MRILLVSIVEKMPFLLAWWVLMKRSFAPTTSLWRKIQKRKVGR